MKQLNISGRKFHTPCSQEKAQRIRCLSRGLWPCDKVRAVLLCTDFLFVVVVTQTLCLFCRMNHDEARGRICVCCTKKIPRRNSKLLDLNQNEEFLRKVQQIFADYDNDNFWMSHVLCEACTRAVRRACASETSTIPKLFERGKKFISQAVCRSTRASVVKKHERCELCKIANPSTFRGCVNVSPVENKSQRVENVTKKPPSQPQGSCYISHKDLKRIQVENGLTQNQILGVLKGFRFATKGILTTDPYFKEFLEEENKIFEDIFTVRIS